MRIKKIIKDVSKINFQDFDFNEDNAQDKFNLWWLPIKEVLKSLADLRLTGRKFDEAIEKVIALGDMVYEGHAGEYGEFQAHLTEIIKTVLTWVAFSVSVITFIKDIRKANGKRFKRLERAENGFIQAGNILSWVVRGAE